MDKINKEYLDLSLSCDQVMQGINGVYGKLLEILKHPSKTFNVTFGNREFNFFPPTTNKEFRRMQRERKIFIKMLLKEACRDYIRTLDTKCDSFSFKNILAFGQGADIKDIQADTKAIIGLIEQEDLDEETEKYGKARPLQVDTYYIEMQRPETEFPEEEQDVELAKETAVG